MNLFRKAFVTVMTSLNSEKFQNLNFKPKLSFLKKNHENEAITRVKFYEFTLYMIFPHFSTKIAIIKMAIFRKIAKIIYRVNS